MIVDTMFAPRIAASYARAAIPGAEPAVVVLVTGTSSAARDLSVAFRTTPLGACRPASWGKWRVQTVYSLSYGRGLPHHGQVQPPSGRLISSTTAPCSTTTPQLCRRAQRRPSDREVFRPASAQVYGAAHRPDVAVAAESSPPSIIPMARNAYVNFAVVTTPHRVRRSVAPGRGAQISNRWEQRWPRRRSGWLRAAHPRTTPLLHPREVSQLGSASMPSP